jgi:hypothetical protein
MKPKIACFIAVLLSCAMALHVGAQTADTIWLGAGTTTYKTGETVYVTVNALSATSIQGFTFQIRYDPACLRPVNASSPVPGMNGLPLPQLTGFVDGSYASTAPQIVNGVLAEVRFTALQGCQTGLLLESAALAIRTPEGFAAPLAGVLLGERNVSLYIDKEVVATQPAGPETGSILPLDPPDVDAGIPGWIIGALAAILIALLGFGAYKLFRAGSASRITQSTSSPGLALHVKQGTHAGRSFKLNKLPFLIGRDPQSDICINDPQVIGRHAEIYSDRDGFYLKDLGAGTFINDRPVRNGMVVLYPGDVVRVGQSAMFVFG